MCIQPSFGGGRSQLKMETHTIYRWIITKYIEKKGLLSISWMLRSYIAIWVPIQDRGTRFVFGSWLASISRQFNRWISRTICCPIRLLSPIFWLVVSTHLKNISQNANLPQIGVKIKNIWNHCLVLFVNCKPWIFKQKPGGIYSWQPPWDDTEFHCTFVCEESSCRWVFFAADLNIFAVQKGLKIMVCCATRGGFWTSKIRKHQKSTSIIRTCEETHLMPSILDQRLGQPLSVTHGDTITVLHLRPSRFWSWEGAAVVCWCHGLKFMVLFSQ